MEEAAFVLDGEDYRDLIPIVVEHEITEAWVDIMRNKERGKRWNNRTGRGDSHRIALLSEFALAHELGLADRYMVLIYKWAKKLYPNQRRAFIRENEDAYELARMMMEKSSD